MQYLLPKRFVTNFVSRFGRSENALIKGVFIRIFVWYFKVNLAEALFENTGDYRSFNDFFTRALKPGARPLADVEKFVLCPADGVVSQLGCIDGDSVLQAKGQYYTTQELLGDQELAEYYQDGSFVTVYLSPKDYHRVHMPLGGQLVSTQYIPGSLFSVNETTTANVPRVLARNERMVCTFETSQGKLTVVLVGALIVAGIDTVWGGGPSDPVGIRQFDAEAPQLKAGGEMGRFFMGSTAVVLLPKGAVEWSEELKAGTAVRMGEALGVKSNAAH